jgi:hypothetical protein
MLKEVSKMVTKREVLAGLAIELASIENAIAESQNWLHEGLCDCDQCLHELAKQRKLVQRRNQVLAEIKQLGGMNNAHEAAAHKRPH